MKKIKVYLQYPWKFPDSPYYKYLLQEHPKEIEYLNVEKQKGVITNKAKFLFSNKMKKIIRDLVKIFYPSMINAHLSPKGDYDLIHCAHCLSKNKDKPWIADIEGIISLFVSTHSTKKGIMNLNKIINSDNCKKILPWTNQIKKELLTWIPNLKDKVEVVYPAIPFISYEKKQSKNIINLVFIGRYFYLKGGFHTLEVMDILTKKYNNVNALFVSEVPNDIKLKYSKNKKIKIYNLMSQKDLFEKIYLKGSILIYPGYSDSFGFVYLEAMSLGIPIITVDGYARKEIIDEGKTGFIIERPKSFTWEDSKKLEIDLIQEIVKKASILIEDSVLRNRMSKECIKVIKEGKFSIKERNKKMKKIYEETLK